MLQFRCDLGDLQI